ncbi:Do family serine endopeptidase [Cyclobacteriaceae bacterium]|nr:Do family serine endopeptidase [Cyclobacteriaceae bacterium]
MKTSNILLSAVVAALVGGAASLGVHRFFTQQTQSETEYESFGDLSVTSANFNRLEGTQGLPELSVAAEKSLHGVVHISNYQAVGRGHQRDPFLDRFFGESYKDDGGEKLQLVGIGSGVVISPDGYIATNNHVVRGAKKLEVVLNDNRSYHAELVGVDPTTDMALLKIDEKELSFIPFGNSDEARVGEWVLAVGNPFNLTSTVTAGIISAKSRNINLLRSRENLAVESFIQTDAAVNPGNSGGALVNTKGELIGINTAIASPTGAYTGYSFAVPSMIVQKVMDDLKTFGTVQRALLGVSIADVNSEIAKEKGLGVDRGVLIQNVGALGAAAEGGLKAGDVIIKVDGRTVNNSSELQEYLARFRPGNKVKITYLREGEEKTTEVTLKNKVGSTDVVKKEDQAIVSIFGAEMQSLSGTELTELRIRNGVRVVKVGGKFANSGMQDGFVITRVEKRGVRSPKDVRSILSNVAGGGVFVEGTYPDGTQAYYGFGW